MSVAPRPLDAAVRHALLVEYGRSESPPDLSGVDGASFVRDVRRQRVAICVGPVVDALALPADARSAIGGDASRQRMLALACAVATSEAAATLDDAGIRALVIKGVALAAQSTGELTARGVGDIDVWVHERDVEVALGALATRGYGAGPGGVVPVPGSRAARYTRWADFELALVRPGSHLDLHWQLAGTRAGLPTFDEAWGRRAVIDIGGRSVATLGAADALVHSCHHALRDGWRWIRSLVDVDRLARLVQSGDDCDPEELASMRAVRLTAAVVHDVTGSAHLEPLMATGASARRAVATARRQQERPNWSVPGDWSPRDTWEWGRQQALLVGAPGDVLRAVSAWALPPGVLVDPATGLARPMAEVVRTRAGRVGS